MDEAADLEFSAASIGLFRSPIGAGGKVGFSKMTLLRWKSTFVLLLVPALILVSGCSKQEAPAPVVTEVKLTKEELARRAEEMRLEQYKKKFESLQQAIRNYPERYDEWIMHLEDMIYASDGTVYAVKAQKLLDDQVTVRESAGKKHFDSLASRVEDLMSEGDPLAAERVLLEEFDSESFGKTQAHKDWLDLCAHVKMTLQAETEFDQITKRARAYRRQEELAEAIGLLESFSSDYEDTAQYKEVRETIEEYLVEYKAARAAKAAEVAVEWTDLTIDTYLSSFRASASDPDAEVWTEEDGEVVGNNTSSGPAQLEIGEDAWEEYVIELEIQLVSGASVNLGITAGIRPGSALKKYDVHSIDTEEEEWVRMRIELKEGLVSVTDLDSLEPLDENTRPYFPMGGLAILLRPDESVRLRNLRYKVFRPVEGEEPDDGGSEEDEAEG